MCVRFGEATESQRRQRNVLAASAFGPPLSKTDFIEREEYMANQCLAQNCGLRTWCLYRDDGSDCVLAACQTLRRELLITDSAGTRKEIGYCIASVVTQPNHRGQGLASRLLHDVAQWLDGSGEAAASMLYSNKDEFYIRRGWEPQPSPAVVLPVHQQNKFDNDVVSDNSSIRLLRAGDIRELCDRDIEALKADAQRAKVTEGCSFTTILPTSDLVRWLHARAEFIGFKIHGKSPLYKGVIHNSDAWMYWHHDFRKQHLFVQRIRIFGESQGNRHVVLATLLLHSILEAKSWKLPNVVVWDSGSDIREAVKILTSKFKDFKPIFEIKRRETASVRWKNGEMKNHMMMSNEHYAWN
ncbi:hypothetical protein GQ44DRAFT_811314 [Phaeosphaeriaceae sp. PMI808]|nr:hypothetical protein GQ44DRAFT_811314 [Phaeosphaeriaceae sp. PMI808]